MRHRSLLIFTTAITAGALTLTACGSRDDDKKSSEEGGTTTVTIGVDAPLTGSLSALGQGIKNSVDLAVKNANKNKEVKGVTFKMVEKDDQALPGPGKQNATAFVNDKNVMAVVGPLNSGVAQSMQGVFDKADLLQISPANTNPTLSQGEKWADGAPERVFDTYFRTCTTDVVQGKFAAEHLFNVEKKKTVFVVDDKLAYGVGLAKIFSEEYTKLGGKIVGTDHVTEKETDFSGVSSKIKSSKAEAVYYGGQYPEAGLLADQVKKAGAKIPLMGGDGIYDPAFIEASGESNEGDISTSIGYPAEELDSAKQFISDYEAAGYEDPYAAYGTYSYDAAWAAIQAVKAVVEANDGKLPDDARAQITKAAQDVSFKGASGDIAFDEFGDTTLKQMTAFKVVGGEWKSLGSKTVE